jgi:hypothetical protein
VGESARRAALYVDDMATKAQLFRSVAQRTGKARRSPAQPKPLAKAKNTSARASKNADVVQEAWGDGHATRRSTRSSAHHGRTDIPLGKAARDASLTPKARATRLKIRAITSRGHGR